MKDMNENMQLKFSKNQIEMINNSLKHWISLENNKNIPQQEIVKLLENLLKEDKKNYIIRLNYLQWVYVHNSISDTACYYDGDFNSLKNIAKNIEYQFPKIYKKDVLQGTKICYPYCNWKNLKKNNKGL